MNFTVLTLFPEIISDVMQSSVLGRALDKGLLQVNAVQIRDFSTGSYQAVDDYPFGGGAGMVMQAEPIFKAYEKALFDSPELRGARVIYLSPSGKPFTQEKARELAKEEALVFLCGHYEGVDQRILDEIVTEEISIGDYVLTGGELPALVVMDAVSRMIPGVLGNAESSLEESFSGMWLEYPQYTRPRVFQGREVPEVLLSGNHKEIEKWRLREAMKKTLRIRPDLIREESMTEGEKKLFTSVREHDILLSCENTDIPLALQESSGEESF